MGGVKYNGTENLIRVVRFSEIEDVLVAPPAQGGQGGRVN